MQKKRHLSFALIGLVAALSAPLASALGWDRAPQSAVLGQPLDFQVSLRLDPGDVVPAECVAAEVAVGDQRLPPGDYRLLVDASSPDALRMRVLTRPAVEELVVNVTLSVGCPARMSRRFVLLADPPSAAPSVLAAAPPAAASPPPVPAAVPATVPVRSDAPLVRAAAPALPASSSARKPRAEPAERGAPVRKAAAAPAKPAAPAARLTLDPVEPTTAARGKPAAPAAPPPAPAPDLVNEAIQAVAEAASAAQAIAARASAAEQRMLALERTVEQLRAESQVNRDQANALRTQLAQADGAGRWLTPLLVALVALAALAAWLWLRLRSLQQEQQAAWRRAAALSDAATSRTAPPASQVPMVTSEIMVPPPPPAQRSTVFPPTPPGVKMPVRGTAPRAPSAPAAPAAVPVAAPAPLPPEAPAERTEVLPRELRPDPDAPRDVSIEELLDLEQQAEFFIVLGQDEAAVDLLVDHLRQTGGGSPLPYLKLLEIYRRNGDREAYERTRTRFNHRFNAFAPDWDVDPSDGRTLEDYPGVLPRLQQVWPRPLDAMAELEALLFRKSRGDLFDLPAYREVLFLYSLARDLLDREAADTGSVDLLLPLADGGEFSATGPHPYLGLEGDSVFDPMVERPTAPVDLDLTQPDTQPPPLAEWLRPRR